MNDDPLAEPNDTVQRRRLKEFGLHLGTYFLVMAVAATVNFWMTPDRLWFVLPMVGWGAPLALHAAWAMGLFDGLLGRKSDRDQSRNRP